MPSEEELLLVFKEQGVEFVETAAKAVGELGDAMETVNQAQQAAVDVLKEEGTVVEDLKEKIRKLKVELESLADAHKAGLITQERYKEDTDKLVKAISENETVLKRLTASETEAQAAFSALTSAIDAQAAAEEKAAAAADKLAMDANRNLIRAQERLDEIVLKNQDSLEAMAGQGEGEAGKGGLAGVAGGAMKAEKAVHSLASGQGLGRLGSMLEGVLGPMGVPGLGMAIGALVYELEPAIPKIKAFFDAWEMGIPKLNDATKAVEALNNAQGEAREKRALTRIEHQITKLEDKEDEEGVLNAEDTLKLRRLREAAWTKEQEANADAAAAARKKRQEKQDEFDRKMVAAEETRVDKEINKAADEDVDAQIKLEKKQEASDKFDRHLMDSEADRVLRENTKAAHEAKSAQTKADHDAKAAATKAAADARMNTPEAQTHREMAQMGNLVMAEERAQNQYRADMGASPFDPSELEQIKHKAMQHMPEARRRGISIGQLVALMMAEQANQIEQGMLQGLGQQDRSRQLINPRGGH